MDEHIIRTFLTSIEVKCICESKDADPYKLMPNYIEMVAREIVSKFVTKNKWKFGRNLIVANVLRGPHEGKYVSLILVKTNPHGGIPYTYCITDAPKKGETEIAKQVAEDPKPLTEEEKKKKIEEEMAIEMDKAVIDDKDIKELSKQLMDIFKMRPPKADKAEDEAKDTEQEAEIKKASHEFRIEVSKVIRERSYFSSEGQQ